MMVSGVEETHVKLLKCIIVTIKNIMLFVALVDGGVPVVQVFIDKNGRPVSVNGFSYPQSLQETVRSALRPRETRERY